MSDLEEKRAEHRRVYKGVPGDAPICWDCGGSGWIMWPPGLCPTCAGLGHFGKPREGEK